MPRIATNGINLHYLDHNPGALGLPLVLLPGLTSNAYVFDGLVTAGLARARRVLALDLRGRGGSDKPGTGYSMAEHAADVVGLLEGLGLEKVVLGGHSFGAWLSLYIAAHYPERVAKLLIIDAAARLHPDVRKLIQPSIDRLGVALPSWDAYLEAMRAAPHFAGWWDEAIESYFRADVEVRADGSVIPRSQRAHILQAVAAAQGEPWMEHLPRVTQPALLLNAPGPYGPPGTPPVLPRKYAEETAALLANCRYVEVPGNHMTMMYGTGAARMVAEIEAFL